MKRKYILWLVVLGVVTIDQITKILVKTNMNLGESIHVFGDWFILHFTENPGMAFGMEFPFPNGKIILTLVRIAALVLIGFYISKVLRKGAPTGLLICLGMIFAGALGNIIDNAFYGLIFGYAPFLHGNVVDMLYLPVIQTTLPQWFPFWGGEEFVFFRFVFNVADASITIAIITILIFQKRFFAFERKTTTETDEGVVSTDSITEKTEDSEK